MFVRKFEECFCEVGKIGGEFFVLLCVNFFFGFLMEELCNLSEFLLFVLIKRLLYLFIYLVLIRVIEKIFKRFVCYLKNINF